VKADDNVNDDVVSADRQMEVVMDREDLMVGEEPMCTYCSLVAVADAMRVGAARRFKPW